jgi:hypothetical protein
MRTSPDADRRRRSDRRRPRGRKPHRRSACPGAYQDSRSASRFGSHSAVARSRRQCGDVGRVLDEGPKPKEAPARVVPAVVRPRMQVFAADPSTHLNRILDETNRRSKRRINGPESHPAAVSRIFTPCPRLQIVCSINSLSGSPRSSDHMVKKD